MNIPGLNFDLQRVLAPVPIWHARVTADDWRAAALAVREAGGRLLALWGGAPTTGRDGLCGLCDGGRFGLAGVAAGRWSEQLP